MSIVLLTAYEEPYDEEMIKDKEEAQSVLIKDEEPSNTEKEESLRKSTGKEHLIDVYEHEPLIGMTSEKNLTGSGRFEPSNLPINYT